MDNTHTAIVASLGTEYPIKGADFIHAIDVQINGVTIATVVTGKNHTTGELGIYFSPDLQLSEEYCDANNLVAKFDENGVKIPGSGFFDEKRRVRAQRFKGAKSEGLWMPLSSLEFTYKKTHLHEVAGIRLGPVQGEKFQSFNDIPICQRYPKYVVAQNTGTQPKRKELDVLNFDQHYDTAQLIHSLGDITRLGGAKLYITEKMHGTSHRVGNVPVKVLVKLPFWKRAINYFHKVYEDSTWEYRIVHGSRRVVLNDTNTGYYGSHDFRYNAVGNPALEQNEVLYGEIVGWVNTDAPIMPAHNTSALKEIKKAYGESMIYDYGIENGKAQFFIYRIRRVNDDGIMQDLPYQEMVVRAKELGYQVPELLFSTTLEDHVDVENIKLVADIEAQGSNGIYVPSKYGHHISEGVVLLFEKDGRIMAYKHKSYGFKVLEGILVESNPEADSES